MFWIQLRGKKQVIVATLTEARDMVRDFIAAGNFGASQLPRGFGRVYQDGKHVATVSYNGRVWTPEAWPNCKEVTL
jgi:hypothetical protein